LELHNNPELINIYNKRSIKTYIKQKANFSYVIEKLKHIKKEL